MYTPEGGHVGEGVFWTNGKLEIYRHCHGVFELRCDGVLVMPTTTFERIVSYMYAEFDMGFSD